MAQLTILNPSDRSWQAKRWILRFGTVGSTYVMVWGSLESALETAASWLADNAPGHIMTHDSDELQELFNEAMQELYPHAESIDDLDESEVSACQEQATADLTYTEAGYLTSYEWDIVMSPDNSRADVRAFIADLNRRNYGDEPTVALG